MIIKNLIRQWKERAVRVAGICGFDRGGGQPAKPSHKWHGSKLKQAKARCFTANIQGALASFDFEPCHLWLGWMGGFSWPIGGIIIILSGRQINAYP